MDVTRETMIAVEATICRLQGVRGVSWDDVLRAHPELTEEVVSETLCLLIGAGTIYEPTLGILRGV